MCPELLDIKQYNHCAPEMVISIEGMANQKKTKILYVITKDDVGGAQKYVRDLAENIDQEKFEVKILTGGLSSSLGQAKIRFLSNAFRPYLLFINDWLAIAELFFTFHKEKPDIIHLNSSKAGVIGAIAGWLYKKTLYPKPYTLNPKVIFTAHGWVFNHDNDLRWPLRQFYLLLHKVAALFQDKIINVSEYDRRLALKHKVGAVNKLITIHNGIDHHNLKFLDKKTARKALSKMLDCHGLRPRNDLNDVWVGSIGRLVKEKNYETFIKAAALIKNPNVKFFIAGNGFEKQKLKSQIAQHRLEGKFFILENLSPAAPYLKAFDIFVLSSIKEGLPYTLLEAMAAGVPIVATRVGGIAEIINSRPGKEGGLIMPPREPAELARAIEYLLKNSAEGQNLAANANRFLKENLTIREMVSKTQDIYLF